MMASACQCVQVGDIQRGEWPQAQQAVYNGRGRRALAQRRLDGPVCVAPALLGMDDLAAHQINHGYQLHKGSRLKILILEYITGGGLRGEPVPPSLALEGGRMRHALVDDLLALADVALIVFNDDRLPASSGPRIQTVSIDNAQAFQTAWRRWLGCCDAAWPIAPETGGVLERLCAEVEAVGKTLLTCPAKAVRLAASKLETVRRLNRRGLPVVPTVPLAELGLNPKLTFSPPFASLPLEGEGPGERGRLLPLVIKPDDGAGCEGARIIHDLACLPSDANHWIAQPLLPGEALSLSALFAQGRARLLSCNRQSIEQTGGGFALQACQVNAVPDTDGRWQALAQRIAEAVPELWGYAGIDLILTAEGPAILEINPRLTTSYAGLRPATLENPAALILELAKTGALPPPRPSFGKMVAINLD